MGGAGEKFQDSLKSAIALVQKPRHNQGFLHVGSAVDSTFGQYTYLGSPLMYCH